ncbi:MAG: IS3 family transposase [Flavobacteriales bacterium]
MVEPSAKRAAVSHLRKSHNVPVSRACRVVRLSKSLWYYSSKKDDQEVIKELTKLTEQLPTRGFDTYYGRLRQQGFKWNRKRVLRVYRDMKLSLRRKHKKRLPQRIKEPLQVPTELNHTWSMDFMSDALSDGRRIRVFNIIDDCNREALAIRSSISFPAQRVVRVLEELEEHIGLPKKIRVDNGPEFISNHFSDWCKSKAISIHYIQPGKPMQNGYIERFNRLFREDVLDAYWFEDLEQLRVISDKWRDDYNQNHPHKSLKMMSPMKFRLENELVRKEEKYLAYEK